MRRLLGRHGRAALRLFAAPDVLLAFDYDGTLAPIVRHPDRAALRPTTRRLLAALTRQRPCGVISGRARSDLVRRLRGLSALETVGNHGSEPWQAAPRFRRRVRRWLPALSRVLASLPGVAIEDKAYSLAIHYRRSRQKRKARAAIERAVAGLPGARLLAGKQVVNVLPLGAPDKGAALRKALARFGCKRALYVGDDETDEDVFALGDERRILSVRVGRKLDSGARYYLRGQAEIDALLRLLQRTPPTPSSAPRGRSRPPST